jgi:hypothetical protein
MALTIVQSPNASGGEKALAGGYVLAEGAAHVALAAGTAGLACVAAGPGCVAAVEGALGIGAAACADGDCGNEIQLSQQLGQNVWQMGLQTRGLAIENALGGNLPAGFKTIDRFTNGIATSIKSIDLTAKTYQNTSQLWSTVSGYVTKLANFQGATLGQYAITAQQITGRELVLATSPGASQAQLQLLQQLQAWAAQYNVILTLVTVQ